MQFTLNELEYAEYIAFRTSGTGFINVSTNNLPLKMELGYQDLIGNNIKEKFKLNALDKSKN